jgi:flavoprotein
MKKARIYVRDTATFVDVCTDLHKGKYSYEHTIYRGAHQHVRVTCPEHGHFDQLATHHRQGRGCPTCAKVDPVTASKWIEKARKVHGDRYDYSRVEITHSHDKVLIGCPEHGWFKQRSNSHLTGSGCPECAMAISKERLVEGRKLRWPK